MSKRQNSKSPPRTSKSPPLDRLITDKDTLQALIIFIHFFATLFKGNSCLLFAFQAELLGPLLRTYLVFASFYLFLKTTSAEFQC